MSTIEKFKISLIGFIIHYDHPLYIYGNNIFQKNCKKSNKKNGIIINKIFLKFSIEYTNILILTGRYYKTSSPHIAAYY